MTGLIPVEPNHILLHNAALVAQARRTPYNTRIRHWLQDVMEQNDTPKSPVVHDDDDYFHLSPLSRSIAEFRDSIYFCDSRRNSIVKFHGGRSDDLSDATTALNSKPSHEKFDSGVSDDDASSVSSFGCSDPESLLPPPRVSFERLQQARSRPRPHLAIEIHHSPVSTKYSLVRHPSTSKRLSTGPIPSGSVCGIPKFELYTFPSPPPSAALRRRAEAKLGHTVPSAIRVVSPTTLARNPDLTTAFVRTTHGKERPSLPRATDDATKLRLAATRMQKKSDRMLAAALRERAEQDRNGFVLDDRRRTQRRVLNQAKGITTTTVIAAGPAAVVCVPSPRKRSMRAKIPKSTSSRGSVSSRSSGAGTKIRSVRSAGNKKSRNTRMTQRDRELGFRPAGVVSREWNTIGCGRAI